MLLWGRSLIGNKCPDDYIMAMMYMIPLYGMSMLKDLSALAHIGKLSVGSVVYLMLLCAYYAFKLMGVSDTLTGKEALQPVVYNYGASVGSFLFALGCHQNIVQVFRALEVKSLKNITLISLFCVIGGSSLYLLIGMCGYFVAGQGIDSSILDFLNDNEELKAYLSANSFDKNLYAIKTGMIAFLCVMFCAFPMQMHPARDSCTNLVLKAVNAPKEQTKRIVTTTFCVMIYLLGSFASNNYGLVIDLIGATATNGITYFVPALVYWLCVGSKTPLGALGLGVGAFSAILMFYLLYVALF